MRTVVSLILLGGLLLSAFAPVSAAADRRTNATAPAAGTTQKPSPVTEFTAVSNSSPATLVDSDADGLSDARETEVYNTDPHNPDTDGDSLTDGDEVNRFLTSPRSSDTDGDELLDGREIRMYNTDPTIPDTDGDSLTDGYEVHHSLTSPTQGDTDGDGIRDGEENQRGMERMTNPTASQVALGQEGGTRESEGHQLQNTWNGVELWLLMTLVIGIPFVVVSGLVGGQYAIGQGMRLLPLRWRLRLRLNPCFVQLRQRYMQTSLYTHFCHPKRCPACGTTSGLSIHTRPWFCSYDCYREWKQLCHRSVAQESNTQSTD